MTDRNSSSGGLTGATGDLTPDEVQRDFQPGEWREASGGPEQGAVTRFQAHSAPAQSGDIGVPGGRGAETGPTELATRESGYGSEHGLSPNDPAYRMEERPGPPPEEPRRDREPRIGGDEQAEGQEHF